MAAAPFLLSSFSSFFSSSFLPCVLLTTSGRPVDARRPVDALRLLVATKLFDHRSKFVSCRSRYLGEELVRLENETLQFFGLPAHRRDGLPRSARAFCHIDRVKRLEPHQSK